MIRKFFLAAGALTALAAATFTANAQDLSFDPIGALIAAEQAALDRPTDMRLKATLYHAGASGVGNRDSLGCQVVAMRTLATDPRVIPRRSVVFIKETVGIRMPDGRVHDGLWYASDTGGAIKGQKVDLYTGNGRASMQQFYDRGLNLATLNAAKVGDFQGCPTA